MKKLFRLYITYREKDGLYGDVTPRFGDYDIRFAFDEIFTKANLAELDKRGYDLTTLKFSIDKKQESVSGHMEEAGKNWKDYATTYPGYCK